MKPVLHITFLHANGYPSGVYRQFFAALREHATVHAPALLETAPNSAAHQRWPMMLDQALDALQTLPAAAARKKGATPRHVLVGHSMVATSRCKRRRGTWTRLPMWCSSTRRSRPVGAPMC